MKFNIGDKVVVIGFAYNINKDHSLTVISREHGKGDLYEGEIIYTLSVVRPDNSSYTIKYTEDNLDYTREELLGLI